MKLINPVRQYYYSDREWDRLGCGPLPDERRCETKILASTSDNYKVNIEPVKELN